MRIWLVNSSEPTPFETEEFRLRRMGILAKMAADRGHEVVWWTSTFFHATKTVRFQTNRSLEIGSRYRIHYVDSPPYKKNISFARIRNHALLGRRFAAWAMREDKPDVILCSYPTLELSDQAVKYGLKTGVPTVLDIRDLWPDLILGLAPGWSRPFGRAFLDPYFRMARRACRGATAIWGSTDEFVDWGISAGERSRTPLDQHFPFGYTPLTPSPEDAVKTGRFWDEMGIGLDPETAVICFFGSINHQFDLSPVLEAARQLHSKRSVQFVFCGDGERLAHYRRRCSDQPHIFFPGWVNAHQIWSLMSRSSFGLAPYVDNENFAKNLANKPIEYLAGGLPILCSLSRGPLYDLVTNEECGLSYGGNASWLYELIDHVLSSSERYRALAANARRVFGEKFEASRVYGSMLDQLVSLARDRIDSYPLPRAA